MAAAQGGGGGGQSESSMGAFWTMAALFAFGAMIWYLYSTKIIHFYFQIKLYEIQLISIFTNKLTDVRTAIINVDTTKVDVHRMLRVGDVVGYFLRIPVLVFLVILGGIVFFANSTRSFKRTYSMRDLSTYEKVNWPQITPVIGLNLTKMDIDKGPWAMAQTPMQFCKFHNLLIENKPKPREGMTRKEWSKIEVTLKRGQANKIFSVQLGSLWQGLDRLSPHTRALFAVFAARFQGDSKGAAALLAQISISSANKLNFTGTDSLLKKHREHKKIQAIMQEHAYILTVMASMLEIAREDGVQASADFLWLKPIDRRLWYMLNTVGRQTPFIEVAGPFAHWVAEKEIGRRLLVPMVEEATNALEIALKEIVYHPDETP